MTIDFCHLFINLSMDAVMYLAEMLPAETPI